MSLHLSRPPEGDPHPHSYEIHEINPSHLDSTIEHENQETEPAFPHRSTPYTNQYTHDQVFLPLEFRNRMRSIIARSADPRKRINELRSKFSLLTLPASACSHPRTSPPPPQITPHPPPTTTPLPTAVALPPSSPATLPAVALPEGATLNLMGACSPTPGPWSVFVWSPVRGTASRGSLGSSPLPTAIRGGSNERAMNKATAGRVDFGEFTASTPTSYDPGDAEQGIYQENQEHYPDPSFASTELPDEQVHSQDGYWVEETDDVGNDHSV